MNVVVFGASGRTGLEIVKQALAAGHQVTAFARNPAGIALNHPRLSLFQGDALDGAAVGQAVIGHQAVISALGPSRPPVPDLMQSTAKNIVTAMKKHGVRWLIATTGAGVSHPQDQPRWVDHIMKGLLNLLAGDVLRDSVAGMEIVCGSGLDWTVVRFPRLVDGPRTGRYRVGYLGKDSGIQVSRADAADFVLKELAEGTYIHQMPVVSS